MLINLNYLNHLNEDGVLLFRFGRFLALLSCCFWGLAALMGRASGEPLEGSDTSREGIFCGKSGGSFPPGDYIFDSRTGCYIPFGGDPTSEKRTDFVQDLGSKGDECGNKTGFEKNMGSLNELGEFVKTTVIGKDDRCPIQFGPKASPLDRVLQGAAVIFDDSGLCRDPEGDPCSGSGHLYSDRRTLITSAHLLYLRDKGRMMTREEIAQGIGVFFKVWVPPGKREKPSEPYEFRRYTVGDVSFGTEGDPFGSNDNDFAFLRLTEGVSEVVDGVRVPERYRITPLLPYKDVDLSKGPAKVFMGGYFNNSEYKAQKNCRPINLSEIPSGYSGGFYSGKDALVFHDADTVDGASGSALVYQGEKNKFYFLALHKGGAPTENKKDGFSWSKDRSSRYNLAIKGSRIGPLADSFISSFSTARSH